MILPRKMIKKGRKNVFLKEVVRRNKERRKLEKYDLKAGTGRDLKGVFCGFV